MAANLKRSSEVIWEELADGALLVSPFSGKSWSLNAAAAALWKYCDGTTSLNGLRPELRQFCATLLKQGLLSECPAVPAGPAGPAQANFQALNAPKMQQLTLASGPRRRPSPRGNSGPG